MSYGSWQCLKFVFIYFACYTKKVILSLTYQNSLILKEIIDPSYTAKQQHSWRGYVWHMLMISITTGHSGQK
jgi:hypothetical protein